MKNPADQQENGTGNKTIRLETPVEKTRRTIRVTTPFQTRIFPKKRDLDDLLVSRKLSIYTSTALDTSPELAAPLSELDGEYTILETFAEGGQATISVARDRNLERIVAVKSLKKELKNRLYLIVSPDGIGDSVQIHQNTKIYQCLLDAGQTVKYKISADRAVWLQIAAGSASLNNTPLVAGDGYAIWDEDTEIQIRGIDRQSNILLFDLSK